MDNHPTKSSNYQILPVECIDNKFGIIYSFFLFLKEKDCFSIILCYNLNIGVIYKKERSDFMTLEEIHKILRPAMIGQEDVDYEEVYYNGHKSDIRYAIDNGLLKPEDLSEDTLYQWINDGIEDEELLARIGQHRKEKNEEARSQVQEPGPKGVDGEEFSGEDREEPEDELDDADWEEPEEEFDEEAWKKEKRESERGYRIYKIKKFFGLAAEQSILPENANVKNGWSNRIKEFLKEKAEAVKNFIEDMFER